MGSIINATIADIPVITTLVNNAYRGEASRKGWTHEADLVDGNERVNEASVQAMLNNPAATILVYKVDDEIRGCVYLEKQQDSLYLGMLSVYPAAQTGGIGKALMQAADEYALQQGCSSMNMSVISARKELLEWYQRRGFKDTGERKPFPSDDKFGKPLQPLQFVILSKEVERK
jgi:ribosomal protein S18 acetylase RimI-like enzyme